jgi:hypothetical protein
MLGSSVIRRRRRRRLSLSLSLSLQGYFIHEGLAS